MKKLALMLAALLVLNAAVAAPSVEVSTSGVTVKIPKTEVSEKYTSKQNALIKSAEAKRDKQLTAIDKQITAKENEIKKVKDNANLTKEQKKTQLTKKKGELKALKTKAKDAKAATKKEIKLIVE